MCFVLGVVLGLVVLLVRGNVPESPRWLFIHGRARKAEELVAGVEARAFVTIARTMFTQYPRRTVLGFPLFIGQAFRHNAITFSYAQILAAGRKPMISGAYLGSGVLLPDAALAFTIGAALMIAAGFVEIVLGVKAERRSLADIARPLTARGSGPAAGQRPQTAT
jgi:hypothetical protein